MMVLIWHFLTFIEFILWCEDTFVNKNSDAAGVHLATGLACAALAGITKIEGKMK